MNAGEQDLSFFLYPQPLLLQQPYAPTAAAIAPSSFPLPLPRAAQQQQQDASVYSDANQPLLLSASDLHHFGMNHPSLFNPDPQSFPPHTHAAAPCRDDAHHPILPPDSAHLDLLSPAAHLELLHASLDHRSTDTITKLQSTLKSHYGLHLTVQQLLAFDALPALLHSSSNSSSSSSSDNAVMDHIDLNNHQHSFLRYNHYEVDQQHQLQQRQQEDDVLLMRSEMGLYDNYNDNGANLHVENYPIIHADITQSLLLPDNLHGLQESVHNLEAHTYHPLLHHTHSYLCSNSHHSAPDALNSPGTSAHSSSIITDGEHHNGADHIQYNYCHQLNAISAQASILQASPVPVPEEFALPYRQESQLSSVSTLPFTQPWSSNGPAASASNPVCWHPSELAKHPDSSNEDLQNYMIGTEKMGQPLKGLVSQYHHSSYDYDADAMEPPAQRRRVLQGITMEQVIRAEEEDQTTRQRRQQQQQQVVVAHKPPASIDIIATPSYPTLSPAQPPAAAGAMPMTAKASSSSSATTSSRDHCHVSSASMAAAAAATSDTARKSAVPARRSSSASATSLCAMSSGSAEPQSIAARHRRKRIREKTESLSLLIPGATRLDTAAMFDFAIKYVNFMQAQMVCLENEVSQQSGDARGSAADADAIAAASSFRRALIHRLLSSPDIQHHLSREGVCLVSQNLVAGRADLIAPGK